jgi:nicotinic acid mononucleotide adenylyltransferase
MNHIKQFGFGMADSSSSVVSVIRSTHDANSRSGGFKFSIAVAGGGSSGINALMTVPGASATVLNAQIPYAREAFDRYIAPQSPPEKYASAEAASKLARAALNDARSLVHNVDWPVGVGLAAALVSASPRRGPHHAFLCMETEWSSVAFSIDLIKDIRTRSEEEDVCGALLVRAISCLSLQLDPSSGCREVTDVLLRNDEQVVISVEMKSAPIERLLTSPSNVNSILFDDSKFSVDPNIRSCVIFPGSFNPAHAGHEAMIEAAQKMGHSTVILELSVANVDKPSLELHEVHRRVSALKGHKVIVTQAPRFAQKISLFSQVTFLVGLDTAERLLDPQYSGGDEARMLTDLRQMQSKGIRFIVADRVGRQGEFLKLSELMSYQTLDSDLREMFVEIPNFRMDISSSEIRRRAAAAAAAATTAPTPSA